MRSISILFASFLVLAGCAVPADKSADDTQDVADSQDGLSRFAKHVVGDYDYAPATSSADFYSSLSLHGDATYSADIRPYCAPGKICAMYLIHEQGTWKATSSRGGTLYLTSDLGNHKTFALATDASGIALTDATGTEHLARRPVTAHTGEHCGGNIATAKKCDAGLACYGGPLVGDVGGTCMVPKAAGESCGFRTQNAPCATGLECKHVSGPLDALNCAAPAAPTCPGLQHWCAPFIDSSTGACHPGYCLFAGGACLGGAPC